MRRDVEGNDYNLDYIYAGNPKIESLYVEQRVCMRRHGYSNESIKTENT